MAAQRYNYCFTYNNYTDDLLGVLKIWLTDNCKYAVLQKEFAPDTGTPHVQGYLSLVKKLRTGTIQASLQKFGIHLHLEYAKGNAKQNRDYCSKAGGSDFWEHGTLGEQGKRSELNDVAQKVLRKRPISEIAHDYPETFIKFHKGIKALAFEIGGPSEERPMETILYFGDTNTGKTTKARNISKLYGPIFKVPHPDGKLWFDGYNGEKSILIDEFKGWITPTMLNDILDKYVMKVEYKGGFTYACWEHVFITSNYPPEEWWTEKVKWHKESLFRRLTSIYEFRGINHVDCEIKKIK